MKKTFIVLLMALAMVAMLFAGGGKESKDAATNNAFQVPEGGYDGSPVTITFYHTMGNYLIDLSFDSSKSTSNRYSFSIEKDGTTLYRQSIKDNSGGFSNLFGFEEGDYILKLQPSYEICDVYSLRVSKK